MTTLRRLAFLGGVILLLFLAGCRPSPAEDSSEVVLNGARLSVSGPYRHENMALFLVHAENQDERDFLTLDEGLRKGLVKVTELEQERVGELHVDNQSDRPLYLQEGERLYGGKQDRTIAVSMVLPPKSG